MKWNRVQRRPLRYKIASEFDFLIRPKILRNWNYLLVAVLILLEMIVAEAQKELKPWRENRYVDCIFCMDYDNRKNLEIYGCNLKSTPTCRGNICYMRQHKQDYWLYTSGCLNLTRSQFEAIVRDTSTIKAERGARGNETILCEVTSEMNTCICTSRNLCNNGSSLEPFTEYNGHILKNMNFNEVAHFKYFLPNDPVVDDIEHRNHHDEYFLIKGVHSASNQAVPDSTIFLSSLMIIVIWNCLPYFPIFL